MARMNDVILGMIVGMLFVASGNTPRLFSILVILAIPFAYEAMNALSAFPVLDAMYSTSAYFILFVAAHHE